MVGDGDVGGDVHGCWRDKRFDRSRAFFQWLTMAGGSLSVNGAILSDTIIADGEILL